MLKLSSLIAALCLLLIIASAPMLASAAKPSLPKRLWAQAYSAVAFCATSEGLKAIEGIHVKESIYGPFNLLVVYNMSSMDPQDAAPWRLFVDSPNALPLLELVFRYSIIPVQGSMIKVVKVGLNATVEMGGTNLLIRAVPPFTPKMIPFVFENESSGFAFYVRGMHFPAVVEGSVDPNLVSGSPVEALVGFLIPEARIELKPI